MKKTSLLLVWGKGRRLCKQDLRALGKRAEEGVVLNYNLGLPVEKDGRATATVAEVKKMEGKLDSNCNCSGFKAQGRKRSPFV